MSVLVSQDPPRVSSFFSPLLPHTPLAIFILLLLSFSLFLLPGSCFEFVFSVSAPSGPTDGNGWGTEWGASYPALRTRERAEVLTKAWLQSKGAALFSLTQIFKILFFNFWPWNWTHAPLQWKRTVLTMGLPGKSQHFTSCPVRVSSSVQHLRRVCESFSSLNYKTQSSLTGLFAGVAEKRWWEEGRSARSTTAESTDGEQMRGWVSKRSSCLASGASLCRNLGRCKARCRLPGRH